MSTIEAKEHAPIRSLVENREVSAPSEAGLLLSRFRDKLKPNDPEDLVTRSRSVLADGREAKYFARYSDNGQNMEITEVIRDGHTFHRKKANVYSAIPINSMISPSAESLEHAKSNGKLIRRPYHRPDRGDYAYFESSRRNLEGTRINEPIVHNLEVFEIHELIHRFFESRNVEHALHNKHTSTVGLNEHETMDLSPFRLSKSLVLPGPKAGLKNELSELRETAVEAINPLPALRTIKSKLAKLGKNFTEGCRELKELTREGIERLNPAEFVRTSIDNSKIFGGRLLKAGQTAFENMTRLEQPPLRIVIKDTEKVVNTRPFKVVPKTAQPDQVFQPADQPAASTPEIVREERSLSERAAGIFKELEKSDNGFIMNRQINHGIRGGNFGNEKFEIDMANSQVMLTRTFSIGGGTPKIEVQSFDISGLDDCDPEARRLFERAIDSHERVKKTGVGSIEPTVKKPLFVKKDTGQAYATAAE